MKSLALFKIPMILTGLAAIVVLSPACKAQSEIALDLMHGLHLPSLGAPADPQAQAVKNFFSGHKLLIAYREGSPLRGTYFFLQVHFCESGNYRSFGESRKQTSLNQEAVRRWSDQGTWVVSAQRGQMGVRCVSSSGQASFVPVRSWPSREGEKTNGISVVPQGGAQCP